ncbi:hypothetical protein CLOM_g8862 [Closterium sp. NIES-68]|nr:hypothetical protein CLOM_g8862 [Closterium sp. NIES-68]
MWRPGRAPPESANGGCDGGGGGGGGDGGGGGGDDDGCSSGSGGGGGDWGGDTWGGAAGEDCTGGPPDCTRRAKPSDTQQGDACDRARVQSVAVLSDECGCDSTDRPSKPIVHPRTAITQATTDTMVGFYRV